MKIPVLKIKEFIQKFFIKKQNACSQYSMEDYFKACIKTDSILSDFEYRLDILACHLLSPTRADLYKQNLYAFRHNLPFENFFWKQILRLFFLIIISLSQVYKACKNLILKKNHKLIHKISNQKTLIVSHADKPYQLYSDIDIYYGKRSLHNADFCILNKTDEKFNHNNLSKYFSQ